MTIDTRQALEVLRGHRREGDVVITTMSAAREWMALGVSPLDLVYVPSSMGQATAVGLGIALAQPQRRVIVCNGDGSMLMNVGSLVTIADQSPANLHILVFDNGVYQITGSQPAPGTGRRDLAMMARGCGISDVETAGTLTAWAERCAAQLQAPGPTLTVLRVSGSDAPGPRSPSPARARAAAFIAALGPPAA